ncbi:DUF2201 family putative metallopeptidase [Kineococcus rubinsiae]|uniref:DUF2201 family putative metallopeptidase n=1 Tax=Kineococcus rubinsiae TaxID=2609562 RepID=UPI00143061E2|nr:VWA-like domain-containing protein [Kineococcus rubinsiae]
MNPPRGRPAAAPDADALQERAALRLAAGRARAGELLPYLGDALYAVTTVPTTAIPTVGVDPRWRMYYNPEFILTLDVAEVVGVWLHEVGHPLRRHHERFDALGEPQGLHPLFNQAGDCAINDDLRSAGVRLPAIKAWYPERVPGAAAGMTAEQIYRLLADSPAGRRLAAPPPSMLLLPGAVRHDHAVPARVVAHTREPFLTAGARLAVGGAPVPVAVHDARTASFDLVTRLPPGEHPVELTDADGRASAVLTVTAPTITLRPDHLPRRRNAHEKVVVVGRGTRFSAATVVDLLTADGGALGAVADVTPVSATFLTFSVGAVPEGTHLVRVRTGEEVLQAALPVGVPHLDLSPQRLPGGHAVPVALAGVGDDVRFDATSTAELLDPAAGLEPVAGALGHLRVLGPQVVNLDVARPLADGSYLVVVTTAGEQASATLAVGTDRSAAGQPPPPPAGYDDCGSGAGGPRRAWEGDASGRDAAGNDDGSVDAGRAELLRQQTARNVLDHVRSRGSVPAGWERWASAVLTPVVDWRRELTSLTRRVSASVAGARDYSYARPSRRAASTPGVVLPAMRQPRPPRAAIVVDTSGSVTDEMLARVHAETAAVLRRVHGSGVQVIACDAAAGRARLVRRVQDVVLTGGGGTDLRVGFTAAAALRPSVDLVLVATDGDTPWPERPPPENPGATYAVLLLDGEREGVPPWLRTITVPRDAGDA